MLASALIIPTEQPPTLRDIKRALLSFDTVHLNSPDDRELIPPNSYHMISTGMPPIFGISVGSVRPLGKIETYDNQFELVINQANDAINQGNLKIRSSPVYDTQFTLGAVIIPKEVTNPHLTYFAYRSLTANPEMIAAISRGLDSKLNISIDNANTLAPPGAEDGSIKIYVNATETIPPYPIKATYPGFVATEDEREIMTRLCHARLGSLAKSLLNCEKDSLIPYTSDIGMVSAIQLLDSKTHIAIDELSRDVSESDILKRLDWLQRVVVTEFINPTVFDELSIKDVLKLRTKAWGKAGEARQLLSKHLKIIALENPSYDAFRTACKSTLNEYMRERADLDHELSKLQIKTMSDVGMSLMKTGTVASGAGMIYKFLSTGSPEIALVLGGLYLFFKIMKEQIPQFLDYMKKKEELRESSGYALFRPYGPFIS